MSSSACCLLPVATTGNRSKRMLHSLRLSKRRNRRQVRIHLVNPILRRKERVCRAPPAARAGFQIDYRSCAWAVVVTAVCTAAAGLMHWAGLSVVNKVMVYFLGVALVAVRHGRGGGRNDCGCGIRGRNCRDGRHRLHRGASPFGHDGR